MSAITSRISPRYTLAYGSLTGSGEPRNWRVTRSLYLGDPVPRFAARGWHSENLRAFGDVTENGFYTRAHAIRCADALRREHGAMSSNAARARRDRRSGVIYTGPDALYFHTSCDQSSSAFGSRSGLPTLWERRTLTYRTRDGVTYTDDTLAEYVAPDAALADTLDAVGIDTDTRTGSL